MFFIDKIFIWDNLPLGGFNLKKKIELSIKISDGWPETSIHRFFTGEDILGRRKEIALCHRKGESLRRDALAEYVLSAMFKEKGDHPFGCYVGDHDVKMERDEAFLGRNEYFIVFTKIYGVTNRRQARGALEKFVEEFDERMKKAILVFKNSFP